MRVKDVVKLIGAEVINLADGDRQVVTGYCGDFLSFVMGKAPEDSCWFTVMTNINVCAVAKLADVAVIAICEGALPSDDLVHKAKIQGVNLIRTNLDVYSAVKLFANEM